MFAINTLNNYIQEKIFRNRLNDLVDIKKKRLIKGDVLTEN